MKNKKPSMKSKIAITEEFQITLRTKFALLNENDNKVHELNDNSTTPNTESRSSCARSSSYKTYRRTEKTKELDKKLKDIQVSSTLIKVE